jgi:transposase
MDFTDTISPFLPLPEGMIVTSAKADVTNVVVHLATSLSSALCPACQQLSERKQGAYVRTIADLPCAGRRVILKLRVRKFVCATANCPQQIFTERLSAFVQSYARMTNRLRMAIQELGFATCGEVGERLAPKLGMAASAPTFLRQMRRDVVPLPTKVRLVGIDDWAWKKGQTYGTILVDLERHAPIELLPDRATSTVEAWLREHPEIEWVSRDRGGNYAAAARSGAPQAQQVADRFHLLKNLREGLKDFLDGKQSCLPEKEEPASDAIPAKARGLKERPISASCSPGAEEQQAEEKPFRHISPFPRPYQSEIRTRDDEVHKQIRRANRYARYEAVRTLYQQGWSKRQIARKMDLCRETVQKYLEAEVFPEIKRRASKPSILDPYKPYLRQRWQERCWNGAQLFAEIKKLGYSGSQPLLAIFLADLRKKQREAGDPDGLSPDESGEQMTLPSSPHPRIVARMSATRASWLFISRPEKLKDKQLQQIASIRATLPELDTAYQLSQAFVSLVAERRAADLNTWLNQAEQGGIAELKKFARGLRRDYAAVKAALSSDISNGQVEGQVHRLKLQKRQVYGRANFDLLRLRVLHHV